eukprot:6978471-Pyramimonas_sp.AAC.1
MAPVYSPDGGADAPDWSFIVLHMFVLCLTFMLGAKGKDIASFFTSGSKRARTSARDQEDLTALYAIVGRCYDTMWKLGF